MSQYTGTLARTLLVAGVATSLVACAATAPQTTRVEPAPAPASLSQSALPSPSPAAPLEPAPVQPAPVAFRASAPLQYVVQPGDTLWGIASRFLAQPWQWPEVWFVNEQVANPHLIYPGDVLMLRVINGRQQIVRDATPALRVLRLGPQVRESALDDAIPAIPLEAIQDFLRNPRMVGADELARAPYIVAFADDQLVAGSGSPAFVKNLPAEGDYRWAVVRPDRAITDPDTDDILGYAATPVGGLEVREMDPVASLGRLTRSDMEARVGDRLVPINDALFEARFVPRAPDNAIDGQVVWIAEERLQAIQYQVVAINRGQAAGLAPGHLLTVKQRSRVVNDPHARGTVTLPPQPVGMVMLFRTDARLSFGLVLEATRPIGILDAVVNPGAVAR